uniref:Uncharacterized protein n=1 Tax=Anguilla anguilla TaxID=7936 RepID=A0A0E9TRD3_ANGAN
MKLKCPPPPTVSFSHTGVCDTVHRGLLLLFRYPGGTALTFETPSVFRAMTQQDLPPL